MAGVTASIAEYPVSGSTPNGIVAGADGNLWFTDAGHNSIDRFTTDGALTTYTLPPAPTNANPGEITAGPDGNLWFLEGNGVPVVKVGKITTAGVITEYATKAGITSGITAGPDGNIWFNERDQFAVARMTPTGTETEFLVPGGPNGGPNTGADPVAITSGPDGNLWVTDETENIIWKVSTIGAFTRYDLPLPNRGANGITAGADGNLWFGEPSQNKIGRMTTAGVLAEFAIPTASAGIGGIAAGPDGNVWFTESQANQLAVITPAGDILELAIPTANSLPRRPTAGPDRHVWFPEGAGKIATVVFGMDVQPWFVQPKTGAPPPAALHGPWYAHRAAPLMMAPRARTPASENLPPPLRVRVAVGDIADVAGALASETQRIASTIRAIVS
jgi:streptogramin lyase